MNLICPLCDARLVPENRSVVCEHGHRFDRARQGYLHLLPVQHKRSLHPGDDQTMVEGRRAFLDAGHYQPIAETVAGLLLEHVRKPPGALLDIGCGEGYYTAFVARALAAEGISHAWAGVDISKDAIRAACRRSGDIEWLVASAARLPFPPTSLDGALSLFAPLEPAEFARVLAPGAALVVVSAGPNHLHSLRRLIYDDVRADAFDPAAKLGDRFRLLRQKRVSFSLTLKGEAVGQLLGMTPHGWRTAPERRRAIECLDTLVTEVDVLATVFARNESSPAERTP